MGYRPESRLKKDHLGLEPGRQSPPLWGIYKSFRAQVKLARGAPFEVLNHIKTHHRNILYIFA